MIRVCQEEVWETVGAAFVLRLTADSEDQQHVSLQLGELENAPIGKRLQGAIDNLIGIGVSDWTVFHLMSKALDRSPRFRLVRY